MQSGRNYQRQVVLNMGKLAKLLHINGIKRRTTLFLVNHVYRGTGHFEKKRKLLNRIGFEIGEGTKVVGPIECTGHLIVGKNCWIGKNLKVNGNGTVTIGDNCDIAPEVTFQTGGHLIGDETRRAGEGVIFNQSVGSGTWIGGRSTILNGTNIGKSCMIAGCACVIRDIPDNSLAGGGYRQKSYESCRASISIFKRYEGSIV